MGLKQAKESVFKITIDHKDEAEITANLEIVSREEHRHDVTIRAVSGGSNLPLGPKPVENPTLEEAYLAFMASRGRTKEVSMSEKEVTS